MIRQDLEPSRPQRIHVVARQVGQGDGPAQRVRAEELVDVVEVLGEAMGCEAWLEGFRSQESQMQRSSRGSSSICSCSRGGSGSVVVVVVAVVVVLHGRIVRGSLLWRHSLRQDVLHHLQSLVDHSGVGRVVGIVSFSFSFPPSSLVIHQGCSCCCCCCSGVATPLPVLLPLVVVVAIELLAGRFVLLVII